MRRGVERMPTGLRRKRLERWLAEELPGRFERRVLPVDQAVAQAWGRLRVRSEASGRWTRSTG